MNNIIKICLAVLVTMLISCSMLTKDRYQKLVSPSNRIIEAHTKAFSGDRKALITNVLIEITNDVTKEIVKLDKSGIEKASKYDKFPEIKIELIENETPYAVAIQIHAPVIQISNSMIRNLLTHRKADTDVLEILSKSHSFALGGFLNEARKIEILEALIFIIAHEATHIWLGEAVKNTVDLEITADAYAVLISSEISLVADQKRQFVSQMMNSNSYSTSDPISLIMLNTRMGGEIMFDVYENSNFSEGNEIHIPFKNRLELVKSKLKEIMERRVKNTSLLESAFWAYDNKILFE